MLGLFFSTCSSYPDNRVKQDDKGRDVGVVGNVSLLQNVVLSSQPISSMDWNQDKVQIIKCLILCFITLFLFIVAHLSLQEGLLACCSFDQTVRVVIVTKLNLV